MSDQWKPSPLGVKRLTEKYGEERTELLLAFIVAHMANQTMALGPLVREIADLGGIFGWTNSIDMAWNLGLAVAYVRGNGKPYGPIEAMKEAMNSLALLGVPVHPVTQIAEEPRVPHVEWEQP